MIYRENFKICEKIQRTLQYKYSFDPTIEIYVVLKSDETINRYLYRYDLSKIRLFGPYAYEQTHNDKNRVYRFMIEYR